MSGFVCMFHLTYFSPTIFPLFDLGRILQKRAKLGNVNLYPVLLFHILPSRLALPLLVSCFIFLFSDHCSWLEQGPLRS